MYANTIGNIEQRERTRKPIDNPISGCIVPFPGMTLGRNLTKGKLFHHDSRSCCPRRVPLHEVEPLCVHPRSTWLDEDSTETAVRQGMPGDFVARGMGSCEVLVLHGLPPVPCVNSMNLGFKSKLMCSLFARIRYAVESYVESYVESSV